MNTELFHKYADIKSQIKALTAEAKTIEEEVRGEFISSGMDKIESDAGSFYLTKRKKWVYSEAVGKQEDKLKKLKSKEEEDGTATFEESETLTFRGK